MPVITATPYKVINIAPELFIKALGDTSVESGFGVNTDSSNNIYVGGYTNSVGSGSYDALVAKYSPSGVVLWQRVLGGSDSDYFYGSTVDNNGNFYGIGNTGPSGSEDILIAKYNSSGVIQWQRTLGGADRDFGRGVIVDSNDDVYIIGYTLSVGAGNYDILIAKYNSSGTIQWQRSLGGTNTEIGQGVNVDNSGNVYVTGQTNSEGPADFNIVVAKYNTSGVIQWQRLLGGTSRDIGREVAIDSSGDIYFGGYSQSNVTTGSNDYFIAKYNSSGTIQWQRMLGGTASDILYSITAFNNSIFSTGSSSSVGQGNTDLLIVKLPNDGSGTGTYGDIVYQASTLTEQASTLTEQAGTLTDQASSLTSSTSSLTDQASTLTETSIV